MKQRCGTAGLGEALLVILKARGFEVGSARPAGVLETTDRQLLSRWLWRAGTASTVEEVFAETPD